MKKIIIFIVLCVICGCTCGCGGDGNVTQAPENSSKEPDTFEITKENTEITEDTEMTVTEQATEAVKLIVATYNIKHAEEGINAIADVIKRANADIIGIQEVDYLNTRSAGQDQPKLLAKAAGYEYYKFTPSIDFKGGKYGTLIMSKYPIESFEYTHLESGEKEGRAIGHAVIDFNGVKIDFFNAHLSYESKDLRTVQFAAVSKMLEKCENYLLTGDFNTDDFTEFEPLNAPVVVNRANSRHATFPEDMAAIDNIIASASFSEKKTKIILSNASDHSLMWTEFEFNPQ